MESGVHNLPESCFHGVITLDIVKLLHRLFAAIYTDGFWKHILVDLNA